MTIKIGKKWLRQKTRMLKKQNCLLYEHIDNQYNSDQGNLVTPYILDSDTPVISSVSEKVYEDLKLLNGINITIGSGYKVSGTDITNKLFNSSEAHTKLLTNIGSPDIYEFTVSNMSSELEDYET